MQISRRRRNEEGVLRRQHIFADTIEDIGKGDSDPDSQ
jgi:hypothetical protein